MYSEPSSDSVAVVARRAGTDVGLGQQEGGDRSGCAARQELALLLRGAEHLDRLRHADRLVCGYQGADARVDRPDEHQGLPVVRHRQSEAAVLTRDLHAEDTQLGEALEVVVGYLRLALDDGAVEGLAVPAQPGQELLTARGVLGVRLRVGVDEGQVERAEVEPLGEARPGPLRLSGRLGDLAGLLLAHIGRTCLGFFHIDAHDASFARSGVIQPSYSHVTRW
jgi:hypothetical protein